MSSVLTATPSTPVTSQRGSVLTDTLAVFQREMSLVLRDPFSVIFSLVQPLVFLGLFGPLLAGSVDPAAINGATPLHRSAILIGKALKELAPLVVQAALVVLVCIPFGFKLYPVHVLVGLLLLGVFGVG